MIIENIFKTNDGTKTFPVYKNHKLTQVILHDYILTKKGSNYSYQQNAIPDLNDGKRHRTRGFIIAIDDKPYPSLEKLKKLLAPPTKSHSNIKTSNDYATKLTGFCPICLAETKMHCTTKFGVTFD